MNVTVLLFARPRELFGASHVEMTVAEGSSPATVFATLAEQAPALTGMREFLRVAIDEEYAGWQDTLRDGAELAFIPPTAGG